MKRREYPLFLIINDILITKVLIDPHYEQKHTNSVNDEIILELAKTLSTKEHRHIAVSKNFKYFVDDKIKYKERFYKLIWMLEDNENYLGIINAYRR
ncbi:MAG: hypothetical protein V4596_00155 [Bdellovibrionota bacterium]